MFRVPEEQLERRTDDLDYLDGKPFTGVAFCASEEGWLLTESEYRNGISWGVARSWYGPDKLESEGFLAWGWLHGPSRYWYPNGQLGEDASFEMGHCLRRKRWDQHGQLTEDFVLGEDDPEFRALQEDRDKWGHLDWTSGGGLGSLPNSERPPAHEA